MIELERDLKPERVVTFELAVGRLKSFAAVGPRLISLFWDRPTRKHRLHLMRVREAVLHRQARQIVACGLKNPDGTDLEWVRTGAELVTC